jgi:hypothetical protein
MAGCRRINKCAQGRVHQHFVFSGIKRTRESCRGFDHSACATVDSAAPEKFSLNKINSRLHFIRFFKTLRYFVAPLSQRSYNAKDGQRQCMNTGAP